MKDKQLLFAWLVATFLGLGATGSVVMSVRQPDASRFIYLILYSGLFLMLTGLWVLTNYCWLWWRDKTIFPSARMPIVRQGVLVATGMTTLLALEGLRVLTWWDSILLVTALILVELSFRTKSINRIG